MGKIKQVDLLSLSSGCLVIVVWLFLVVPWICLQFVIVIFSDHTHLLFFTVLGQAACIISCLGIILKSKSSYEIT